VHCSFLTLVFIYRSVLYCQELKQFTEGWTWNNSVRAHV